MITTVTLNPAIDKTIEVANFAVNTMNRVATVRTDPGGKGINVSKVIASLGGSSRVIAVLGGDSGKKLANAMHGSGLYTDFVFTSAETRTNLKVIDPVGRTNTDINEPGSALEQEAIEQVLQKLDSSLQAGDILVLAGSLPAGVPVSFYRDCILRYSKAGVKVFLDADDQMLRQGIEAKPYFIKPNRDELERLYGSPLESREDIIRAAAGLVQAGIQKVVVSLGKEGALMVTSRQTLYCPAIPVEVKSTVGAGDSMVAAFAYSEDNNQTEEEGFRLAMAASNAAVMCSGSQAPVLDDIQKLLPLVQISSL